MNSQFSFQEGTWLACLARGDPTRRFLLSARRFNRRPQEIGHLLRLVFQVGVMVAGNRVAFDAAGGSPPERGIGSMPFFVRNDHDFAVVLPALIPPDGEGVRLVGSAQR